MTTTNNAPAVAAEDRAVALLQGKNDAFNSAIANLLPKGLTTDRVLACALSAFMRKDYVGGELRKCSADSIRDSLMKLSFVGMPPDGRRAALIPYKGSCTAQVMFQGLVELVHRSGLVKAIECEAVRANDKFRRVNGRVFHEVDYSPGHDRGDVILYFVQFHLMNGGVQSDVMTIAEVNAIRNTSASWNGSNQKMSPWFRFPVEMGRKTVFKRGVKYLMLAEEQNERWSGALEIENADYEEEAAPKRRSSAPKLLDMEVEEEPAIEAEVVAEETEAGASE